MLVIVGSLVSCGKFVKWVCCRQLNCCGQGDHSVSVLLSGQVEDSFPWQVWKWSSGLPHWLWTTTSHLKCFLELIYSDLQICVCLQQALLKEQLSYLDHLAEQLRREKEQEKEDEKVFKEERDQIWADKVERMKQEREARFQLLRDVVDIRQAQMEEKCKWSNTQLGRGSTTPCCWPSTHCVMERTTMWPSLNLFPKCNPTGFPSTNSPLPSPEQGLVKQGLHGQTVIIINYVITKSWMWKLSSSEWMKNKQAKNILAVVCVATKLKPSI